MHEMFVSKFLRTIFPLFLSCLIIITYVFYCKSDNSLSIYHHNASASPWKVNWRLYGDGELVPVFGNNLTDTQVQQHAFLSSFQEDLLNVIPLKCATGVVSRAKPFTDSPQGHWGSNYLVDELLSKKYQRFLKALESYTSYHDTMGKSPSRRTLIWWCSKFRINGGLGDRIRGVTYALLLAMHSRRRLLIVWSSADGYFLHPHMINWKNETVSNFLNMHESGKKGSADFINLLFFSFWATTIASGKMVDVGTAKMENIMKSIGSNETNIVLSTNLWPGSLLDGKRNGNNPKWLVDELKLHGLSHFSDDEVDDLVGLVFRYLFKLDNDVLDQISAAAEVLGLNHSPYVAVHIRTGFAYMPQEEYGTFSKRFQVDSVWKMALHCAIKATDELPGKNMTYIFLATDSNLVKKKVLNKYGMRIRTLGNTVIHVDKLKNKSHPLTAEEKEGFIVVWIELLLMAQSTILVRQTSGLSGTAGLLCGLHNRNKSMRTIDKCS